MTYQKAAKNLPYLSKYITYAKISNYFKYMWELKKKPLTLSSFPPQITFQASGYCNSNCQLCPVGLGIKGPKTGFLDPKIFYEVVDEAKKYLMAVNFADWGEPFLNPNIFEMIKYAEEKKIVTHASTNLHRFDGVSELRALVESGLSFIIISLHGVSETTYQSYQPNKSFEKTLDKIRLLLKLKKELKRKTPVINLAFAITKKNQHEIPKMRQLAKDLHLGSSVYTASLNMRFYLPHLDVVEKLIGEWAQDYFIELCNNNQFEKQKINMLFESIRGNLIDFEALDKKGLTTRHFCNDPWSSLTVNWDGTVSLCCTDYWKYPMGNVKDASILDIWNNERYVDVRRYLLGQEIHLATHYPCETCLRY
jgi:MoaA/NifB/PqqE/SkfB family radical SAM enzyme